MGVTVTLPDELIDSLARMPRPAADAGATESGVDEVVERLVREGVARHQAFQERLEELAMEGLESGPPIDVDDAYRKQVEETVAARVAAGRGES